MLLKHQYEVRINVLLFTLPSNITYIAQALIANSLFLLDPVPPYDPSRHSDRPPYQNAHGGHDMALRLMMLSQRGPRLAGMASDSMTSGQMDKAKQVEVQKQQVDEVFKSLDNGGELEQSDPGKRYDGFNFRCLADICVGLLINTELFPHQRRALTFMLQREQDSSALKTARKLADKKLKKGRASREETVEGSIEGEVESQKGKEKDRSRSLWEGKKDEKGRTRLWKNKLTGDELRAEKGEKPMEGKGAILADDVGDIFSSARRRFDEAQMGLGKTLCVVSLIAATRRSSWKWAKTHLEVLEPDLNGAANGGSSRIKASEMKTKVFGMPMPDSDEETSVKEKKRKREESDVKTSSSRRARLCVRSKATLLVCPMSTITNWEEQIKEHWDGPVEIFGGAGGILPSKACEKTWKPPKKNGKEESDDEDIFAPLRIYIYHGPARRPDPDFIAKYDIVITSYNTLALEYTKQSSTGGDVTPTTPGETAASSSDEFLFDAPGDTSINNRAVKPEVEAEIKAAEVADALRMTKKKGKAPKKLGPEQTSPLQAVDWFRVVLDEAQ